MKLGRSNRYPGPCCVCDAHVPVQRGFLLRGSDVSDPSLAGRKWLTLCTDRKCAASLLSEEDVAETERKAIDADGRIYYPKISDVKPLIQAIGSWDPERKAWFASPLYRDRDHVLRLATKLELEVDPSFAAYDDPPSVKTAVARARAIETIREYQVAGVRWLAYRGLTNGAPEGFEDKSPGVLLADDMGLGKQQPVDTKVLTPSGWREIGDLQVGDRVIGSAGTPVKVTGVFPQGIKPSYRLTTHDGASVESGPEHLWTVLYRRGGKKKVPFTVTTEQLRTKAKIEARLHDGKKARINLAKTHVFVPMLSAPVEFDPVELPLPPYTLGALIANGSLAHGSAKLIVNSKDLEEIKQYLIEEGSVVRKWRTYNGTSHAGVVLDALHPVRELGLDKNSIAKFIPEVYQRATPIQRLTLLQGLMDGDGSCSKAQNRVTYHTISPQLARDVRELVENLGGGATVRKYDRTHEGKPVEYQVRVRLPEGVPPFRVDRKLSRYNPTRFTNPVRGIKSVEYVRDVESVCISVDAEDHLYVTEHALLTHNTIQTLLSLADDEALLVVCPANAKAVWPREAKKWRPGRFDEVTICSGIESFKWPSSPRELVVINYDILPLTPALIRKEREGLEDKRFGREGDPKAKKKAEREPVIGLLSELFDVADEYSALTSKPRLTTADRHELFLLGEQWRELSDKVHRNRGKLRTNARRKPADKPACKTLLVFDEVHYAESNKAARTAKCRYIANKVQRLYGLTGTPADSDPRKQWGIWTTTRSKPMGWETFKRQYSAFEGAYSMDFERYPPKPGSTAKGAVIVKPGTTELLARTMLRRTADDPAIAAELPPLIFTEVAVELKPALVKKLDGAMTEYAELLASGELPPSIAKISGLRKAIALACIPAMLEFVEKFEVEGEPLVVFSAHRAPVEVLGKREGWYAITGSVDGEARGRIQDAFQGDPDNDVPGQGFGVAGTDAMAESMTLTRASKLLQVDPFWKLAKNKQAIKRVHRLGQTKPTHIIQLVPDHPFVRHVTELLAGKEVFVSSVLEGDMQVVSASPFTDRSAAQWRADVEAKEAGDVAREQAQETRERKRQERALTDVARHEGAKLSPKSAEQRARLRCERLDLLSRAEGYTDPTTGDVQDAFAYMQAVCDGAREKDAAGWNKSDSVVAAWLSGAVAAGYPFALASAVAMLRSYPRQLREQWPGLFEKR